MNANSGAHAVSARAMTRPTTTIAPAARIHATPYMHRRYPSRRAAKPGWWVYVRTFGGSGAARQPPSGMTPARRRPPTVGLRARVSERGARFCRAPRPHLFGDSGVNENPAARVVATGGTLPGASYAEAPEAIRD